MHSIYQKLQRQKINVDQMYDLLALRIITHSVNDCYAALGIIHNAWRPVPGRIKDFIAMPRPNLYQSLHTTVITEDGYPFEVQIRTEEMHKMAEEGSRRIGNTRTGRLRRATSSVCPGCGRWSSGSATWWTRASSFRR